MRDSHNYPFYLRSHCDLMSLRTLEVWDQDHSDLTCEENEWITDGDRKDSPAHKTFILKQEIAYHKEVKPMVRLTRGRCLNPTRPHLPAHLSSPQ